MNLFKGFLCCSCDLAIINQQPEIELCQPIKMIKHSKPITQNPSTGENIYNTADRTTRSSSRLSIYKMPSLKGDSSADSPSDTRSINITIKPITKSPLKTLLDKVESCMRSDVKSKSSCNNSYQCSQDKTSDRFGTRCKLKRQQSVQALSNKGAENAISFCVPSTNSQFRYVPSYFNPQMAQEQKFDADLATALAKVKCGRKSREALKTSLLEAAKTSTSFSGELKQCDASTVFPKKQKCYKYYCNLNFTHQASGSLNNHIV
eukprot:TRINITY_DN3550_c0_g1_i2.p1 TRINITY_DN3550_c0_g1~~TRINITY_DN3550_c0_g1_i2.p1  ORF type:complete len:262 (-),score=-5.99 TRINITY_DN3550_c0_g1_i2:100-885(-)